MKDLTRFRRGALLLSLVLAPVLMLISSALQPPFVEGYVDRLNDIHEAGAGAWAANSLFIATQVPMLVVIVGIAHLVWTQTPRLAAAAIVLGVIATFAEAVMGGTGLVYLTMAPDADNREVFAGVWESMESSPVMLYAMLGFGGTVLTLILLSIALFLSRVVPRWVPGLVGAFLLLEFFGSDLSAYASYAAALCLLVAFMAIARHVRQASTADPASAAHARENVGVV